MHLASLCSHTLVWLGIMPIFMVGQIQLMSSLQSLALFDLDVESKILSILMAMKTEKPGTLELQVFAS